MFFVVWFSSSFLLSFRFSLSHVCDIGFGPIVQLCRIMSYRKYAYDLERAKKNKMKEMGVVSMKKAKGMRFTDRIGKGDIDTKVRSILIEMRACFVCL